jgi:3-oxoacyl-[acyl-carrier protein] reductase
MFRIPLENWEKVLSINLTSAFLVSKHIAMDMMKRRTGSIINMASIVGIGGNVGQTNYSASKAGLIGFSKSLAKEVASRGVRVNAVAPGFIITEMTEKLSEDAKKAMLGQVPMGRGGTPEEVAKAVLFLASDLSSYITGRVIQVDGGMMI